MFASRRVAFLGMLAIAMIAVQADAALFEADPLAGGLPSAEPSLLLLLLLGVVVAFATAANRTAAPVRRRRVNRARRHARRAGS